MPNYSKAPRGLFVLVELGRVFTANAISPSESSRQLLARDAIRAGRNLPDTIMLTFLKVPNVPIWALHIAMKFRLYHNPASYWTLGV